MIDETRYHYNCIRKIVATPSAVPTPHALLLQVNFSQPFHIPINESFSYIKPTPSFLPASLPTVGWGWWRSETYYFSIFTFWKVFMISQKNFMVMMPVSYYQHTSKLNVALRHFSKKAYDVVILLSGLGVLSKGISMFLIFFNNILQLKIPKNGVAIGYAYLSDSMTASRIQLTFPFQDDTSR